MSHWHLQARFLHFLVLELQMDLHNIDKDIVSDYFGRTKSTQSGLTEVHLQLKRGEVKINMW